MASTRRWLRFRHHDKVGFGTTDGDEITEYVGDLFAAPEATGRRIALAEIGLLPPVNPSKIVALWNNFHALSAKLGVPEPSEPLYLLKAPSSITAPGATVHRPPSYDGKIVWEGELAIVIGNTASG